MADLWVTYNGSATIYAVIRRQSDGFAWDVNAEAFEAFDVGSLADYAYPEPSLGGDLYGANLPADIPNGTDLLVQHYEQAGVSPATTDLLLRTRALTVGMPDVAPPAVEGDHYTDSARLMLELGPDNTHNHADLDRQEAGVHIAEEEEWALTKSDDTANQVLAAANPAAFPVVSSQAWVNSIIVTAATEIAAGELLNLRYQREHPDGTAKPGDPRIARGIARLQALVDMGLPGVTEETDDTELAIDAPVAVGATVDEEGREISEPPPVGVYYDRNARAWRWN